VEFIVYDSLERKNMPNAEIILSERNPFDLTLKGVDKNFRLAIEEPTGFGRGTTKESQDLMRAMMTAHLLAPTMPENIYTNFDFHFSELLDAMYEYYGKKKPRIMKIGEGRVQPKIAGEADPEQSLRVATSHSGGLDSVYRIAKLLENKETPLAVHLRNLNFKGNAWEAEASREQCESWGVPYLQVKLRNSSGSTGFDTMKTRDLLLALVVAIQGAPNNVNQVLIEGGMGSDPRNYHFSESIEVWSWFNGLLKDIGLDVEVVGVDPGDIETIGEIIDLEKQLGITILPMVQNCFSAPFQMPNNRRKWERETPTIAQNSSDHWCGSCHKCRRMTLGRLFYHDPRLSGVSGEERGYFVKDTYDWIRKYPHNADLLSESFMTHLELLGGIN